ncbi:MAG: flagellar biosynthesis repressor FlbT [Aestuariivirga sp.]|jgi:flagellar protein FlbT
MKIHLKRNEKLFINGAVIRLDRRGSIELMNDAQFLMENHILQQEDAKTPLQQVYFIVQTMLMDPANSHLTKYLLDSYSDVLVRFNFSSEYNELIGTIKKLVQEANYYGALKLLRQSFHLDQTVGAVLPEPVLNNQYEAA